MKTNPYSGKFIVFDGLDGSGLSTQANLLKDFLLKKGYQVISTKEPTKDSEAGKKIRELLDKKSKTSAFKLQKLFTQDRKEHLEKVIIPALKGEKIVISDRYSFSTLSFGAASGVNLEKLIEMQNDFLLPDLTFFLKVSPDICLSRIRRRGNTRTLFEEKKKLEEVWKVYEALPDRFDNVFIVNGEKSIPEVFQQIQRVINQEL